MNTQKILQNAITLTAKTLVNVLGIRSARRTIYPTFLGLQPFEPRMLFSVTWNGLGDGHTWSDIRNWGGVSAPVAGDNVIFTSNATVTVDTDYDATHKLGSLKVSGNADVKLNFDHNNAAFNITNKITLDQTSGNGAKLKLAMANATANTNTATIAADGLNATGSSAGYAIFVVDNRTTMNLTHDLDMGRYVFGMTVNGVINAANMYLQGKDIPGSGAPDSSLITVNGTISSSGELRVGGNGIINFSDNGYVSSPNLNLGHRSTMDVGSNAELFVRNQFNVGDFTGQVAGLGTSGGAILNIEGNLSLLSLGMITGPGTMHIGGGNGTAVAINGGNLSAKNITVDDSNVSGATGPELRVKKIGANVGTLESENLTVGLGNYGTKSGLLVIEEGAEGTIKKVLNAYTHEGGRGGSPIILQVDGQLTVGTANLGFWYRTGVAGGMFVVNGRLTAKDAGSAITVGDDAYVFGVSTPSPYLPFVPFAPPVILYRSKLLGTGIVEYVGVAAGPGAHAPGQILKLVGGDISLTLRLSARPVSMGGTGADLIPGDGIVRDEDGNLISNGTNSTDAFGTLTIDGDMDASEGFTLDTALGTSGSSSLLLVTGEAALGGHLLDQFRAIPTDVSYAANYTVGDSFTLLTAASISGYFTVPTYGEGYNDAYNLEYHWGAPIPEAIAKANLPALSAGLQWCLKVTHTSAGTASTDSLILAIDDYRPQIHTITPEDSSDFYQFCDIAFTLPYDFTATTSITLEGQRRINGSLPGDAASSMHWNSVTAYTIETGTDGTYHATANVQLASTYRFRLKVTLQDGSQFTSDAMTMSTLTPAYEDIGLYFAENTYTYYDYEEAELVTTPGNSLGLPIANWTNEDVHAIDGFYMRSVGNIYGDEWVVPNDHPKLATWLHGEPVEFIASWYSGGTNHYAHATATASGHPAFGVSTSSGYTLWSYSDTGGGPDIGTVYHFPGFSSHATVLMENETGNYKFPVTRKGQALRMAA